jgi:hypothetical protein
MNERIPTLDFSRINMGFYEVAGHSSERTGGSIDGVIVVSLKPTLRM